MKSIFYGSLSAHLSKQAVFAWPLFVQILFEFVLQPLQSLCILLLYFRDYFFFLSALRISLHLAALLSPSWQVLSVWRRLYFLLLLIDFFVFCLFFSLPVSGYIVSAFPLNRLFVLGSKTNFDWIIVTLQYSHESQKLSQQEQSLQHKKQQNICVLSWGEEAMEYR